MQAKQPDYSTWPQAELVQRILDLERQQAEMERQQMAHTRSIELMDALRWHDGQTLATWSDAVLTELVPAVGAVAGALYTYDAEHRRLLRCGGYALPAEAPQSIAQGEGLAGQAASDGAPVHVADRDRLKPLGTGMAQIEPAAAWFQPLETNNKLVGLLELSALNDFSLEVQHMLPQVAERLSVQLASLAYQDRIQDLFRQAQERSEQLNAQEEELRQNLEELSATQEEMQRVQQVLATHDAQLNSILNGSQDIIIVLDRNLNLLYFNQVARNRYARVSIHLEEGLHFPSVLPSKDAEARNERYRRVLAGESFAMEMETQAFGDNSYVRASYSPLMDAQGNVQGITMYIVDLTQRRVAELNLQMANEELETQQEELRQNLEEMKAIQDEATRRSQETGEMSRFMDALLDQLPVACYVKEPVDLRFVRFNRMAQHIFGFDQQAILGKSVYDLYPREQAEIFMQRDRDVLSGKTPVLVVEEEVAIASGERRLLRTTKRGLTGANGQATHLIVIAEDLSK